MGELGLMFTGALLAATLLPGGSELLLLGFLKEGSQTWWALLIVASAGNTLGALTSYYLGSLGRLAKTPEQLAKRRYSHSIRLLTRYGSWVLLFSWVPLIGDLLCLLAGWLKLPVLSSGLMMLIGKTLRYAVLIGFYFWGTSAF
jgi:membrane protein YqaA with SNARE-associated domain